MKQLRGRSLGTRLNEAEYAQCEKAAARRGQTMSEWCRGVLLHACEGAATDRAPAPEAVATLAEILALRKIVVNLLYGERTGEPLDEGRMRELIEAADAEKFGKSLGTSARSFQQWKRVLSGGRRGGRATSRSGRSVFSF